MKQRKNTVLPGLILVFVLAIPAWFLGRLFPLIGGPVFGILIGILLAFFRRPSFLKKGIWFTSKQGLQIAVILLGFEMNLYHVFSVGSQSLIIMLFTLVAAFITTVVVGNYLNLTGNLRTLIGVGTAICGGSAIAATAPVINADDREVAYSISTVFLFNIAAVFIFPLAGHLLNMSDAGFGIWAGTAINDTSSVVAAGYAYSETAGDMATIVKLARSLMIVPVSLGIAFFSVTKNTKDNDFKLVEVFPWFVLGFLLASVIKTTGFVPGGITLRLTKLGKFMIIMALMGIGLNTNLKSMGNNGVKPILLGLACSVAVALTSLGVQHVLKLW